MKQRILVHDGNETVFETGPFGRTFNFCKQFALATSRRQLFITIFLLRLNHLSLHSMDLQVLQPCSRRISLTHTRPLILTPPTAPPGTLLLTPPLLLLPPPDLLHLLQSLHPFRRFLTSLPRYRHPSSFQNQLMQAPKTIVHVLVLFPRIVGLDDEFVGFGSVVARAENRRV